MSKDSSNLEDCKYIRIDENHDISNTPLRNDLPMPEPIQLTIPPINEPIHPPDAKDSLLSENTADFPSLDTTPINHPDINLDPVYVICPYCKKNGYTIVSYDLKGQNYICMIGFAIIFWPLALAPLLCDECKYTIHKCPHCKKVIAESPLC